MQQSNQRPAPGGGPAPRPGYIALLTGRRSRWIVAVLWLALIGVAGTFGSKIGSVQDNEAQTWLPSSAQSTQAVTLASEYFAAGGTLDAVVVYARPGGLTAGDRARIDADHAQVSARHLAPGAVSPVTIATDGRAAIFTVPLPTSKTSQDVLGNAVDELGSLTRTGLPPGLEVRVTGPAGDAADFIHAFSGLDGALLGATIAVVALLLLLTYRSPVLWLIPLLAAGVASQLASGVVYLLAIHAGLLVNGQSASILTVLVLGVSTDYALLLIARYREELRRHPGRREAMAVALRRCLPAITASAATVVIATLCLALGSMNSTRGLGPVAAVGVAVAYLAMTTLLPVLLVILGRWVFWPVIPRYDPASGRPGGPAGQPVAAATRYRGWSRLAHGVGRAPRPVWIAGVLVLGALATGSVTLSLGQTQADQFTTTTGSVAGQQLLAAHFPAGSSAPADIYTPASAAPQVTAAARTVAGIDAVRTEASAGGWTHIIATLSAPPDSSAAQGTIQHLRDRLEAVAPGSGTVVGGQSAIDLDTAHAQASEEELLIPLILAVVLVMLIVVLRSLLAPVMLLVSVALSYAAAVGTAALIFRALGYPHIDRGLLLIGFLFLVALGVDYTIFLMTRAREEAQRHGHHAGIIGGLAATGGVITSAGLVLAATFAVLAVLPVVSSLQQGTLIAVGVLLDTFLVRSLVVPALALDIGPRLWWPARLSRDRHGSSSQAIPGQAIPGQGLAPH